MPIITIGRYETMKIIQKSNFQTTYQQCSPCQLKYQFVTHLEESAIEWNFLLEKLKVADVTYIPGKYEWSPATKDEAQWHTIPRYGLNPDRT